MYATFEGSASYYPSHAVTAFSVDPEAATPTPAQQITTGLATSNEIMMYVISATVAIIIAIVIVGLLILRKRP